MKLLIKNGTVIDAGGRSQADVAVEDGKITGVIKRTDGECAGRQGEAAGYDGITDAAGLYVLPGAIDAHVHFSLPYSFPQSGIKGTSADSHFTGTRAAACGGVTSVIDFVTPQPGETLASAYNRHRSIADPLVCTDYRAHMSVLSAGNETPAQMQEASELGINSFKVFLTYDFRIAQNELVRVLARAKELGAVTMIHAEANDELEALRSRFIAEGKTDPWHHYLSRPEDIETKGIEQAVAAMKETGSSKDAAPLYIVHLACAGGLEAIKKARSAGYEIYAETCPQYLHFTNDAYKHPGGHNFVCSPPVKGAESRAALRQGIADGSIDTIATDHCPFMLADKARGRSDFTVLPNGVGSIEFSFPYMLSLACNGVISFERAVELCCRNPARIFKIDNAKGSIETGKDADIVIFDPNGQRIITQENSHSAADHTIWEGVCLSGQIKSVCSRGNLIYKDGVFLGRPGTGRFIQA